MGDAVVRGYTYSIYIYMDGRSGAVVVDSVLFVFFWWKDVEWADTTARPTAQRKITMRMGEPGWGDGGRRPTAGCPGLIILDEIYAPPRRGRTKAALRSRRPVHIHSPAERASQHRNSAVLRTVRFSFFLGVDTVLSSFFSFVLSPPIVRQASKMEKKERNNNSDGIFVYTCLELGCEC